MLTQPSILGKIVSTYFIVFSKVCRSHTSHRRLRPSNFSRFTSAPLIQPVFSLVESHITPTDRQIELSINFTVPEEGPYSGLILVEVESTY